MLEHETPEWLDGGPARERVVAHVEEPPGLQVGTRERKDCVALPRAHPAPDTVGDDEVEHRQRVLPCPVEILEVALEEADVLDLSPARPVARPHDVLRVQVDADESRRRACRRDCRQGVAGRGAELAVVEVVLRRGAVAVERRDEPEHRRGDLRHERARIRDVGHVAASGGRRRRTRGERLGHVCIRTRRPGPLPTREGTRAGTPSCGDGPETTARNDVAMTGAMASSASWINCVCVVRAVPAESLLVFSDVHLGSDLNDCTQNVTHRSASIDRDLVLFLEHYRREKPRGSRWRIVIAGDFIDFIGMSIAVPAGLPTTLPTAPNEEERAHGLGNASDHARLKLSRVAERHADVFAELARFVAEGHALTIVHGNHDIEFHWDGVKDDLRAILERHARRSARSRLAPASSSGRLQPVVLLPRRGRLHRARPPVRPVLLHRARHGARLPPGSAPDRARIHRGAPALRRATDARHGGARPREDRDARLHRVRPAARARWARPARGTLRRRRDSSSSGCGASTSRRPRSSSRGARATRRAASEATRIGMDRLRALLLLQAPPITKSVRGILASLLIDRIALAVGSLLALSVVAVIGAYHGHAFYAAFGVLLGWALFHFYTALVLAIAAVAGFGLRSIYGTTSAANRRRPDCHCGARHRPGKCHGLGQYQSCHRRQRELRH